ICHKQKSPAKKQDRSGYPLSSLPEASLSLSTFGTGPLSHCLGQWHRIDCPLQPAAVQASVISVSVIRDIHSAACPFRGTALTGIVFSLALIAEMLYLTG